jgi:hypothetical protein
MTMTINADAWLAEDADLLAFDHEIHQAEGVQAERRIRLDVSGTQRACARARGQVALRYQRLAPHHNDHSGCLTCAALRRRHRELHDLSKPLVRADYEHAVDVWQWLLRLAPAASLELQAAALFHDIERLQSEPDARVEHRARDYTAFKREHARRGAAMVLEALRGLAIDGARGARIAQLVARHEQPEGDEELSLLNDADALSFFALNSPGFFRYYDRAHCEKKVAYTLARMSNRARAWLPALRLERPLAALLAERDTSFAQRDEP